MKATEAKLLDFLRKSQQFVIPIYQRTYSWTNRECQQLWDDILRVGRAEVIPAHFIGSIVYIEQGLYQVSSNTPLLVIDGQQRLTTVTLIIEALARALGPTEPFPDFSARKLRNRYLQDPDEVGDAANKLLLTQTDKSSLIAITNNKPLPDEYSIRIKENFEFICNRIEALKGDLVPLCKGLAKLMVVDISLSRDQDNPQLIFESMNSTVRELTQADLIRNYILMGLEPVEQEQVYEEHWRPMEEYFGQKAYADHFDDFMRYYLTVKEGELPNKNRVYEVFKTYFRRILNAGGIVSDLVADVQKFSRYYCAIELNKEANAILAEAFSDLRDLKANVAYPLLLATYDRFASGAISESEFERVVRLVESYVFRRSVCDIPTNSMNRTFESFARGLNNDKYLESIEATFIALPSRARFPRDEEFSRSLVSRDLYNYPRRSYWLRRIENHERKERVRVDDYTIEHIMPQNENLSPEWQAILGSEWRQVHETWLHTLGNLTLTGYNSEYGDKSFDEKRDMAGGFKESPLRVNFGLGQLGAWGVEQIKDRAERLALIAINTWITPSAPQDMVENLKLKGRAKGKAFTHDQHEYLAPGRPARKLFDEIREKILGLDPLVTEETRVRWISYKAETNFVDIAAQTRQLKIWLNMRFHELNDPTGIARDVTDVGHHGSGDVELNFDVNSDLTYVMSLVRQSFERQMDDTGAWD